MAVQVKAVTLKKVRTALRLSSGIFDADELKPIIGACILDLQNSGITMTDESDELILRAITLYAKAHFGFDENADKFQRSYDMLKCSLSLAGDYNGAV
jgi:hypothetical protein